MKVAPGHPTRRIAIVSTLCAALFAATGPVQAALSAGALAIIGYNDNESENSGSDSFALVATETLTAGEVVYITNNGWNNSTHHFEGADISGPVGAGAEDLVMLTINSTILAGTVIKSTGNLSGAVSWTTSGGIPMPMGASGSFSELNLKWNYNNPSGPLSFGDEMYIFQASSTENPLLNVSRFIYALDFGERSHSDTENWYDSGGLNSLGFSQGGNLPNGQVSTNPLLGSGVYITVPTVSDQTNGDPNDNTAVGLDPTMEYYNGTFGLDLSNQDVIDLQTSGGTKEQWLALINNTGHWASVSSIFDNTGAFSSGLNFTGVPEPTRALFLGLGVMLGLFRRRRL